MKASEASKKKIEGLFGGVLRQKGLRKKEGEEREGEDGEDLVQVKGKFVDCTKGGDR